MSEINWNEAPEGAERCLLSRKYWLKRVGGRVWSMSVSGGQWVMASDAPDVRDDWENAIHRPVEAASEVDKTVNERGERYGKFTDGAEIMQSLKNVMRESEGWSRLTNSQREGLEMIQHKIGRVLNGDPNYDDNYRDIAGYATLLLEECNGVNR